MVKISHPNSLLFFVEQGGSENAQIDSSVVENNQQTENDRDTGVLNESESQTKYSDGSLENTDTNIIGHDSSDGQCQMNDATSSKTSDEGPASGIDPGPAIPVEAVPANAGGNGNTYGKKESIFVTLSRKIKALEQNVTMTNLFLEELSQRYVSRFKKVREGSGDVEATCSKPVGNKYLQSTCNCKVC